jgi:hypothetical protein
MKDANLKILNMQKKIVKKKNKKTKVYICMGL